MGGQNTGLFKYVVYVKKLSKIYTHTCSFVQKNWGKVEINEIGYHEVETGRDGKW